MVGENGVIEIEESVNPNLGELKNNVDIRIYRNGHEHDTIIEFSCYANNSIYELETIYGNLDIEIIASDNELYYVNVTIKKSELHLFCFDIVYQIQDYLQERVIEPNERYENLELW